MKNFDFGELFSGAGGLAFRLHAAGLRQKALYERISAAGKNLHYKPGMEFETATQTNLA